MDPVSPCSEGARRAAPVLAAAAALLLLAPPDVEAQAGCVLGDRGRNMVAVRTLPGIGQITYIGGPHFTCEGRMEIFADSAVFYEQRRMIDLIDDVRFLEEGRTLRSETARYFSGEGRLQAQGDVVLVDEEQGSRIEDGDLVYLPRTEFREVAEMTVTREADGTRPTAVLTPRRAAPDSVGAAADSAATRDSVPEPTEPAAGPARGGGASPAGPPPEPYTVHADRLFLLGSGYFTASGDVEIVRDSLFAYADSAEYDQAEGALALEGNARVEGTSYELTGRSITMSEPGGARSTVLARREARLTGEDVLLTSARILVVLEDGALDRLVATPLVRAPRQARRGPRPQAAAPTEAPDSVDLERPEALVQDFVLTADSLEVTAPQERIQRVFAAGRARSVSAARDSLNVEVLPEAARDDWLEGDTVIIRFPGAPPVPALRTVPSADTLAADTGTVVFETDTAEAVVEADTARSEPEDSVAAGEDVGEVDETEPEEIIARGSARSLYRLAPNDTTFRPGEDPPAVHYVVGQEIRIFLDAGEVDQMRVAGQTRGVHLEPLRRARADSAQVADSLAAPADTAVVDTASTGVPPTPPDTGRVVVTPGPAVSPPGTEGPRLETTRNDAQNRNDSQKGGGSALPPKDPPWIRP